jgi:hypothetical protein
MKSKAEQLAEERYPYIKDKVIQNVVINAQRAAFIAGYEAAMNELTVELKEQAIIEHQKNIEEQSKNFGGLP